MSSSTSARARLDWVDYAKGICIFAVVMMYAARDLHQELGQIAHTLPPPNWLDELVAFAKPFRMPDFFLISGLFLANVIDRPWRTYLDKKLVHYLYFFVLWSTIIFVVRTAAQPFDGVEAMVLEYLTWMVQPYAMLWFVQLLAVFFVFTKLTRRVPPAAMLAFAAALYMAQIESPVHQLQNFAERFVFFYAGYVLAPQFFRLAAWVQERRLPAVLGLVAWAVVNATAVNMGWATEPLVALALGMAGACAVIAISGLLSLAPWMRWLSYLGRKSLVIYVGFYIPLAAATRFTVRAGWPMFDGWGGLGITLFSILAALCLYWAVRHTWLRWLFERPAWAQLEAVRKPAVVTG